MNNVVAMIYRNVVGSYATAEELMKCALSLEGVSSAVIGYGSGDLLLENAEFAANFDPSAVSLASLKRLEKRLEPFQNPLVYEQPG